MAENMMPDSRRCNYFFLYDGTKVRGESDRTLAGICYFYPEETPLDKQELLCGQVAGVARCVSELSSSPVRMLRLRRSKFAVHMKDDFLWALGCHVDIPDVSICNLLDQLINLFCFYNGSIRQSYQRNSRGDLAVRWGQYLFHLQAGSTELHHIFSCLRTIDSTHIDPLLLLKAALILQACQRCSLVLAGCILFRGRVVSTQMSPDLTVKVMVHEADTYKKDQRAYGASSSSSSGSASASSAVTSTTVFLTAAELNGLRSSPVDRGSRPHSTPKKNNSGRKVRLSRTLSDTPSSDSEPEASHFPPVPHQTSPPGLSSESRNLASRPAQSSTGPPVTSPSQAHLHSIEHHYPNGKTRHQSEVEPSNTSNHLSLNTNGGGNTQPLIEQKNSVHDAISHYNGRSQECWSPPVDSRRTSRGGQKSGDEVSQEDGMVLGDVPSGPSAGTSGAEGPLIPMMLYQHRVRGLVLALLVEPQFSCDTAAMEEVYHSSMASLNGLEAHLRTTTSGAPGPQGPYIFAHFDCVQNTLTTNLSGRPGGAQERPFVKATSMLHSHFFHTETLQEAIIRSAGVAVFGTRSVAQETYFQQQGGTVRNSGIPNPQDSAFSLPSKARHRLLKHGVNLL